MMYFISHIESYSSVNAKGREFQKWLDGFAHKYVTGHTEKKILIEKIKLKIAALDNKYPRSKPIRMVCTAATYGMSLLVTFNPAGNPDQTIARFYIHDVKGKCNLCFYEGKEEGGQE